MIRKDGHVCTTSSPSAVHQKTTKLLVRVGFAGKCGQTPGKIQACHSLHSKAMAWIELVSFCTIELYYHKQSVQDGL